ncbi:predicted protein [Naegleria gruberi]|uniref:Predicted protein n=1 Tax=Naegleria gruberi TaxID=5762 RepID=D2UZZ6_NAEGR|nr:uncharacterized protein NAEGRDRAFT_62117 [Naegleria gruberi]EFC50250.1 predicted protein [Naegleria gruberi]|eukprot:XP_002682994.1 predicted protein [Naegleria gruberi strain NEG-M]
MNQEEYCRVLYDFKADGHNELSVTKGEVVKLISAHGEWMMVEKVSKPFQKGFVPTLYITIIKNSSYDNSKANSLTSSVTSINEPVIIQQTQQPPASDEKRKNKQSSINTTSNNSSNSTGSNPLNENTVATASSNKQLEKLDRINNIESQLKSHQSPSKQSKTSNSQKANASQSKQIVTSTAPALPLNPQQQTHPTNYSNNSIQDTPTVSKNAPLFDERVNQLPKPSIETRKSTSSTPLYSKNSQKPVQKQLLSGFVTKVVAEYEDSVTLMQSYETNEKIFKQTLVQREEAFKSIEQKLDKISKEVLDFQTTNDQLIDKIRRLELRIENDRSNLINNYSTDVSGITEASERKRNASRNFQSGSKN